MRLVKIIIIILSTQIACSNVKEMETTEIKTLLRLNDALQNLNKDKVSIDSRNLIDRTQINNLNIPILFVELPSGQNGTLTKYPGSGKTETWLDRDGATVTLRNGVLKATRGLGNDIMGGETNMPDWSLISNKQKYRRTMSYLEKDNQIIVYHYDCSIEAVEGDQNIEIFQEIFITKLYVESCAFKDKDFKNKFFVDKNYLVRKSLQYHSDKVGYLIIERVDLTS